MAIDIRRIGRRIRWEAQRFLKRTASDLFPMSLRKTARYAYASMLGALGMDYFPGPNGIDRRLLAYIGHIKNGTFVEAGANDGLSQSNTWHLEKRLGWRGLLVEPVPGIAALCRRFRSSPVENCALGTFDQEGEEITLHFGGLMTIAEGADTENMSGGSVEGHAKMGAEWMGDWAYSFQCRVRALSILLDKHRIRHVDLLSLDVEGFEDFVLQGIDFARHPIRFILIETNNLDRITATLGTRYRYVAKLSVHDYLFEMVGA